MTTVTQKLITAEEFFGMPSPPDGSQQELVRGVIVTMPPPGGRHGACCLKVGRRIGNYVEEKALGTATSNDTGFVSERDPDTVRGPDLSFWSRDRLPELPEGYVEIPPDLAVEVVSPSDHYSRVQNKVRHYLSRGVRMVWVVDPEDRSVTVYRPPLQATILEEAATLSGEDILPGFSCRVGDLFP
jgi:Uma2 family endonuclease